MNAVCQFCAYYSPIEDDMGECRRKPPQLAFHHRFFSLHEVTVFPKVKRNNWCGEHKEKNECQQPTSEK